MHLASSDLPDLPKGLCCVFRLDLSCLSVALAAVRAFALSLPCYIYLYSISMLAATNAAACLSLSLSLSCLQNGAQVCLPMAAIHYHAGDIFVLPGARPVAN